MPSSMKNFLSQLTTEQVNKEYGDIDQLSVAEVLSLINVADASVPVAVGKALPQVERAVEAILERLTLGGRLIYFGAGTSGRLGVLDAAECGPTFNAADRVFAVMAGGPSALTVPVEGAEDDLDLARADVIEMSVSKTDVVVGITASGLTPYVCTAVEEARKLGALTVGLSCNTNARLSAIADYAIEVETGPEIIAGSTRMKAASAQKMVLNMISTTTMIGLGKTYGNLMVDVQITNGKLFDRAVRIIVKATGATHESAKEALTKSGRDVKVAIVMLLNQSDAHSAQAALAANRGSIRHSTTQSS